MGGTVGGTIEGVKLGEEVKVGEDVKVGELVSVGERVEVAVSVFGTPVVCVAEGMASGVGSTADGITDVVTSGGSVFVNTGDGKRATRSPTSVSAREMLPRTMLSESRAARTPNSTWRKWLIPAALSLF